MASARLGTVVRNIAGFLSGAETDRPVSPEYLDVSTPSQETFLVTYGSYGILPSFDPDCLAAICWLRICGVEVVLEEGDEPGMSPNERLPFIMFSSGKCIPDADIHEYGLRRSGKSEGQSQLALAASTLLRKSIKPALLATIWLEEPMKSKTTRRNYSRSYPWPISEYMIWRMRRQVRAEHILNQKGGLSDLRADAVVAVKNISELLGSHDYFCGSRPGYVDAVAYGLLAVALVVLPPSHELRTMIETCSSLRSFIGRIRREYFD